MCHTVVYSQVMFVAFISITGQSGNTLFHVVTAPVRPVRSADRLIPRGAAWLPALTGMFWLRSVLCAALELLLVWPAWLHQWGGSRATSAQQRRCTNFSLLLNHIACRI